MFSFMGHSSSYTIIEPIVPEMISHRVRSMMRMTMADMATLADARPSSYRLENADSYLIPPAHVLDATRAAVGQDPFNSYLPLKGLSAMREAVAHRFAEDFGLVYDPESEIVITSGAGESLLNALLVVTDPGDRVLLTNPTYSGMAQRVRLAGGRQVFCELVRSSTRWALDLDQLREQARGCRVIFFASPVMPTGSVLTRAETEAIAEVAVENDALVIFNGHADRVSFGAQSVVHPASLPGMYGRTITVGCISKNYGMPGWRIGWAAAPPALARALEDAHIFNGIMPSGFAQAGAIAALTGPQNWQAALVAAFERNQRVLLDGLAGAEGIDCVPAEGGYYFLADVARTGLDADSFCTVALERAAVALTPMRGWGSDDFGHAQVRFIFTNEPAERLHDAAQRLVELVRSFA
jgi:N-succinyldiaminopimelate aminotransferase